MSTMYDMQPIAPAERRAGTETPTEDTVVILGEPPLGAAGEIVRRAAARAHMSVALWDSATEGAPLAAGRPSAVLLPFASSRTAALAALAARAIPELTEAPIVALSATLDDVVFEEAFAAGIDDCVPLEELALTRTMRALRDVGAPPSHPRRESVVIADASRDARITAARVFRGTGFQVAFAASAVELASICQRDEVSVVVVSAELARQGARLLPISAWARKLRPEAAWLVTTPPRDMTRVRSRLGEPDGLRIEIHDAFAVPSSMLFVANGLRRTRTDEKRRQRRVLYGTSAFFRPIGRRDEHIGFTYNVSAGGLYIRTLAPPEVDERLWIELMPPRSTRLVHLEATVRWRRLYGPKADAVVPPGCGVEVTGGSAEDLDTFLRGCAALAGDQGSSG